MRTARKIRYRLEWLGLKSATKFLPLLSRKACYRDDPSKDRWRNVMFPLDI
jgi:hypothetical protein